MVKGGMMLTERDFFAGLAMKQILANNINGDGAKIAHHSYELAERMMEERKERFDERHTQADTGQDQAQDTQDTSGETDVTE